MYRDNTCAPLPPLLECSFPLPFHLPHALCSATISMVTTSARPHTQSTAAQRGAARRITAHRGAADVLSMESALLTNGTTANSGGIHCKAYPRALLLPTTIDIASHCTALHCRCRWKHIRARPHGHYCEQLSTLSTAEHARYY